jgi:hypothetical protein
MQGPSVDQGLQEPRNRRLAGGVELPDTAVLLAPAIGA